MDEFEKLVIEDEENRRVLGWATVEIVDRQGDIMPLDSFKKAFADYMSRNGIIMRDHQNKPVGKVIYWDVAKNNEFEGVSGIKIIAQIYNDTELSKDTWDDIKANRLKGFSVGGKALNIEKREDKQGNSVRILKEVELNEISIVEEPANQGAYLSAVSIAKALNDESKEWVVISKAGQTLGGEGSPAPEDHIWVYVDKAVGNIIKEKYPWKKCIEDQEKDGKSHEVAQKICGSIKAKYGKSLEGWEEKAVSPDGDAFNDDGEGNFAKPFAGFADFETCQRKMMEEYHDEETAKKVCGKLQAEHEKAYIDHEVDKAITRALSKAYLWEDCITAQMDRYHNEQIAERVCGKIRSQVMRNTPHHRHDVKASLDKANYESKPLTRGIAFIADLLEGNGSIEDMEETLKEQLAIDGVDKEVVEETLKAFREARKHHIATISKDSFNTTANISENMSKLNKTQIHDLEENMDEAVDTESGGLKGEREKEKATLASKIEERAHKEEEEKADDEEEEDEEKADSELTVSRDLQEIKELLTRLVERLGGAEAEKAEEDEDEEEDTEKANYKYDTKDEDSRYPEPKEQRTDGISVEQFRGKDSPSHEIGKKNKVVKKHASDPSGVVDFGRNYMNGSAEGTFTDVIQKSLSGKIKTTRQAQKEFGMRKD